MKKNPELPLTRIPEQFEGLALYTVSELREHLSLAVKSSFHTPIILRGIIASDPSVYPSFAYMDLKDEKENMTFNLSFYIGNFHNIQKKLKTTGVVEKLTKDVPIMLVVEPYVSTQKRISFVLRVIDVIPEYTSSVLANEKNITLSKLEVEGILDLQKQMELPYLVKNIGLISSDQGTSVQDISSAMSEVKDFFNIYFVPARVEGKSAVQSIVSAINKLNSLSKKLDLDVILIARGGGSSAELSIFNDYELCRTVCLSKLPIITAIGHDKDQHAIELCSHLTPIPSTPSGIGAYLKQYINNVKQDLAVQVQEINLALSDRFTRSEALVNGYIQAVLSSVKRVFSVNVEKIKSNVQNVSHDIRMFLQRNEEQLLSIQKLIEAYDHSSVLKRGYALVWDEKDKLIKTRNDLKENATIEFVDGKVEVSKKR
ncbi:MAG TPA: exodeoxyribonuclease VII large subunit [bacterium]|nr:exodeoxyribonuclease VII large subunit [bacterium]